MYIIPLISFILLSLPGHICVVNSSFSSELESLFDDIIRIIQKLKGTGHVGQGGDLMQKDIPAFSAYLDFVQYVPPNVIVKFNKVWTNNLNGYDVNTGIFTAPMRGLYHFSAVFMSEMGKTLYLHLWHNKKMTAGSYTNGDGLKTGTFDVVLTLKKGDRIYIRCKGGHYSHDSQRIFSDGDNYSTFSGYRIA